MNNKSLKQKSIAGVATLFVIALLVVGGEVTKKDGSTPVSSTMGSATASSQMTTDTGKDAKSYKDGQYMATGNYSSPGGQQSIVVNLTLADNKVTDVTAKGGSQDGVAQVYQSYFEKGYKGMVVGKPINNIKLSRVSGSSLTSNGFNDALKKIKQQAAQQSS